MEMEDLPSGDNSKNGDANQSKEIQDFRRRLGYLRQAIVIAFILHIIVTAIVMKMGFSEGKENNLYMSPSIVTFGFGCLNTVVFAGVECYTTLQGTSIKRDFPSWHWHNDSFLSAVGNVFFLSLFLLPSLIIYMLHSKGLEFFQIMSHPEDFNVYGKIVFHIFAGVVVFILDAWSIIRQTKKLHTFQVRDEDEEEEKKSDENEDDEALDDDDEDETRPVTVGDRLLAFGVLGSQLLFIVDLAIIAFTGDELNSGTSGSTIISLLIFLVFLYFTLKFRKKQEISESWLLNHRLAIIGHLFAFLCFWWVALSILVFEQFLDSGFFGTLNSLPGPDKFLSGLLFLLFFIYLAVYAVILYVHSRSMRSLDEIASLYLAARLQEKYREGI